MNFKKLLEQVKDFGYSHKRASSMVACVEHEHNCIVTAQGIHIPEIAGAAGADMVLQLPYQFAAAVAQYRFVELTGDQAAAQCNAITDKALGVTQQEALAADITSYGALLRPVMVLGVSWTEAGAAITRDAFVGPTATGKAQTAVSTQFVSGRALKGAAADTDWIPVLLMQTAVALA